MISIIIAVKDNKRYTELCIDSIRKNTINDYELIIIDNASKEQETIEYLSELRDCNLISNKENMGCAYAWNQGIKKATGRYVCIINNDILVPKNWLSVLVDVFEKTDVALLSPCMKEGEYDYGLEEYNKHIKQLLNGRILYDEYRGVCLFAEKQLFDKTGLFDENYKIGKYEDEDLFLRIKEQGLKTAVTTCLTVHHYGSKTINAVKKQNNEFEAKNREYFYNKWKHKWLYRKVSKLKIKIRRKLIRLIYKVEY